MLQIIFGRQLSIAKDCYEYFFGKFKVKNIWLKILKKLQIEFTSEHLRSTSFQLFS